MKLIILFLIMTFSALAKFNLEIPNDINTSLLKRVIENGWNDSNKTLNTCIIKHGEIVMPEAMQKIKKPLIKAEPSKSNIFSSPPKILLTRDDYFFILAYVKYLEYKGELDLALNTYIEILKGLNNTGDNSLINFILHLTIEKITITGLNESLNKNIFSQHMKTKLKNELKDLLILDAKNIMIALEGEKESILKAIVISLDSENSAKDSTYEYKKYTSEVHDHWKKYTISYFDRMKICMEQMSPKSIEKFELFMDKEKEERDSFKNKTLFLLSASKAKIKNFLLIGNESYGFVSQHMGQSLALTSIPKMVPFFEDYSELIRKNEKLLSSL